jgi:hypothetical protein
MGWVELMKWGQIAIQLAKGLARKEGISAAEFDAKVAELNTRDQFLADKVLDALREAASER